MKLKFAPFCSFKSHPPEQQRPRGGRSSRHGPAATEPHWLAPPSEGWSGEGGSDEGGSHRPWWDSDCAGTGEGVRVVEG